MCPAVVKGNIFILVCGQKPKNEVHTWKMYFIKNKIFNFIFLLNY